MPFRKKFPILFVILLRIIIVLITCFSSVGMAQEDGKTTITDWSKLEMKERLLKGSRWAIEQMKQKQKVDVYHAIEVVDISKVDMDTMSIRIEIHIRQRWESADLKMPKNLFINERYQDPESGEWMDPDPKDVFIQVDPKILEGIWSPDSYIPIARDTKIHSFSTTQSVVNIFNNKTIVYKARIYTILGCMFDFTWYPLDKQVCSLQIESYTSTNATVTYLWETNQQDVVYSNLKLNQYDLHMPMKRSVGVAARWGRHDFYPYVQLDFEFERQLGHHMIQVFIPTILVVILSWFSFWLGLDAIPGRVSLLITCMLTLVTMHSSMKGAIPPVNYIKMMDVWMVGVMAFVFLALCEFVVVKYLHWKTHQELKVTEEKQKEMKEYMEKMRGMDKPRRKDATNPTDPSRGQMSMNPYADFYRNMAMHDQGYGPRPAWMGMGEMGMEYPMGMGAPMGMVMMNPYFPRRNYFGKANKTPSWIMIDKVSRFLFPFAFGVFNATFWPYLILGADGQNPSTAPPV